MTDQLAYLDARAAESDAEARYLARLDSQLARSLEGLADPNAVDSVNYGGVLVWLTVPGVPDGEWPVITNRLQLLFTEQSLQAYWGCAHLWDDYDEKNPEHLNVPLVDVSPEAAADRAADWLREQLSRPRVREEWDRRVLLPAYRWVLGDNGTVLGRTGIVLGRRRRAPSRVVSLPDE